MIRTQIYLPEDVHTSLQKLANKKGTTLSKLIREGAETVLKKHYGKKTPQQKALHFLANYPDELRIKLTKSAVELVREQRN